MTLLFRTLLCWALVVSSALAACPHGFSSPSKLNSERLRSSMGGQDLLDEDGFDGWEGPLPMAADPTDTLVRANQVFRVAAKLARDPVDNHGRHLAPKSVLIVEGDYFVLRRNGKRVLREAVTPELVQNLKMVSHIPVGLFSMLVPHFNPDKPTEETALPLSLTIALLEARAVYAEVAANATALSLERFLDAETLERQKTLVQMTLDYIDRLLASGVISLEKLQTEFVDRVSDRVGANVLQATRAQIDALRRVLTHWEANVLSEEEKNSLRIVLALSHMAKPGFLTAQFFSRWYGIDEFQSERMIIMEGVYDERKNTENFALHVHDGILAASFLGDSTALHRDLQADLARSYLDEIFGPAPPLRQLPGFPPPESGRDSTGSPAPSTTADDDRQTTARPANSKRERTLIAVIILLAVVLAAAAVERCIAHNSRRNNESIDFAAVGGPEYARFGDREDSVMDF